MTDMARRAPNPEFRRKVRGKNLAVMAALIAFCVLIYLVTLVRMGGI